MQRLLLVLLITTGAISLSGCGFFSRGDVDDLVDDVTIEDPSPEQTDQVEASGNGLPTLPDGDNSGTAVEGLQDSPTVIARDLIQSTDPNERAIGVERTRNDPFAELTIPLVPPEPIVPESNGSANNNGGNRTPNAGSSRAAASASNTTPQQRPSVAAPRQVSSSNPEIAALPEIPQPTTARAVRVSGVIQVGGSPYAIVKAPNEIERYVTQGERIAGGSVVVKRIDTRSAEPRVILVENGIEVERLVTAAEEGAEEAPQPAEEVVSTISALPALPSPGI